MMKFNKWKHALERFADHESSKYHCDSVLKAECTGAEPDIFIGGGTGGASFATRGAVNGLCMTFRKRSEKFWGGHWGSQAKFGRVVVPPGTPLAPPLGVHIVD